MKSVSTGPWLVTILACFGTLSFLFLIPNCASAQEVIGISAILGTTNSTHIDTYSATEMDSVTAFYYDAYVEGYLFQNSVNIVYGAALGNPTAAGGFTMPLTVGDTYEIDSYHYLVAFYAYTDGTYDYYYNPYNYLEDGSGDPSGSGFLGGGGPAYYTVQYIELGYTYVVLPTGVPSITSISPNSGAVESSGTMTVQGSNLEDLFTQTTTPNITGSGMSLSVQSVTPNQVTLGYTIAQNASTGAHNITLATRFGTSNAVSFNVGDPTPVVTGVSPNIWEAGTNISVTITGRGFGTSPTVTLSGSGVTVSSLASVSDTQISANVSVSSGAPTQTVTIQVQSNGYFGSGFVSTTSGESASGSNTATVEAEVAPIPQIFMGANSTTNIVGTNPSVLAGQQIILTACIDPNPANCSSPSQAPGNPPAGTVITSQSWTIPGTSIGGYLATQSPSGPTSASVTPAPNTNTASLLFYWIDMGSNSRQISYNYTLSNGGQNSVTVTFNVDAPSGLTVSLTPSGVVVFNPPNNLPGSFKRSSLLLTGGPNGSTTKGMVFFASATHLPPGSYQWVQLINSDETKFIGSLGPFSSNPILGAPEIDHAYPYGYNADGSSTGTVYQTTVANDTAQDSPASAMPDAYGEFARSFKATMYLMWIPNPASGCNSACTVPVPLGSVGWQSQGDAINELLPKIGTDAAGPFFYSQWILNSGILLNSGFQLGGSLPEWSDHYN